MSARQQRGGLWNMHAGRPDEPAASVAWHHLLDHRLDFLALCEAGEYVDDLRRIAKDSGAGQVVHQRGGTVLLVRAGVEVDRVESPRMTTSGWWTVRGRKTGPKYATSALLAGWLRVTVVHLPPSVWARGFSRAPKLRAVAYVAHQWSLARYAKRRRRQHVILADWNATPHDRGLGSPYWLSRKIGAGLIRPAVPTFGRRVIDFAVARGVRGWAQAGAKHGSDHRLVLFTFVEKLGRR